MKKNTHLFYCLIAISLLASQTLLAQWNSNPAVNTPVCTFSGKQIDLRMTSDGHGGSFISWKDYRAGLPDIYIQYLNSLGIPQWTTNGVGLCTDPADQSTPAITTDMTGGAIVAFSDWRSGIERDVYAQRIDSMGVIQWTLNGVGVATKPIREHNEKIISDDAGGAIIVWEQQQGQWDIWAQHINHAGVALWPFGGIPVCTVNANRLNPKVQKDGKGGAIITWQDIRNLTDYNVYAQRINPSGILLWGSAGITVCSAPDAQTDPKIDPDSITGGAYISWIDKRNGIDYDIYAQRIDSTGTLLWQNNGMPVTMASGNQSAQDILSSTSTNGLIVTWKDNRSGNFDIYAQKLNPSGTPQWTMNGVPVCNSLRGQVNPNIVKDQAGGAIITWQDSTLSGWDIKAQHVKYDGTMLWTNNGVDVGTATEEQSSPKSVSDGMGGCIFAWQDKRNGFDFDIYAHHLYSNGSPLINVGVQESSNSAQLSCYPNPFTDEFNLQVVLTKDEKINIVIEDVLGREIPLAISNTIQKKGLNTLTINADKTELPAGIYYIKIIGDSWTKTIKVVRN